MPTQPAPHAAYPYQLPMTREIAHHRHDRPYATLILSGAYEEAGDSGRWRVEAGDVLIHGAFSAHRDGLARRPSMVLDLPLPFSAEFGPCCGRVRDPDAIVAAAANDRAEAADLLIEMMTEDAAAQGDAPDLLARALTHDGAAGIADWASEAGLTRETLTRQFSRLYGLPPARYRAEARARAAWRQIVGAEDRLADIAAQAGFADQPHMNRGVKALTGYTPGQWRRWRSEASHRFKT
ncbi:AraC family transcriptional regulator [Euryhalocaulis sp.]|uniref:helix-turn-helix domain-containing protein n=1 Tax=Euryhalocaulis sp. TaxID=2744307 RepID=UPI00257A346E|nr:AraC family transcriptional regulator [Euryhalocaulis sp.]